MCGSGGRGGGAGAAASVVDEDMLHDEGENGEAGIGLGGVTGGAIEAKESFVEEGGGAEGNGAGLAAHEGLGEEAEAEVSGLGDLS